MQSRMRTTVLLLGTAVCCLLAATTTRAELQVTAVDWETQGALVVFHVQFYNPDPAPTSPGGGGIYSQEYGAFLPDAGTIGVFDIPPIEPESFFDVFLDIPYDALPPSAGEILPWLQPMKQFGCGADNHWDGNVDIIWSLPGAPGQVNAHYGTLQVCPGYGNSYIHVVTACPGWANWWFAGVCQGWTVTLVNEDFTPAPNPVAPGWSGHICVSADATVPFGAQCCFSLNFNCGGVVTPVNLCAVACDCGAVADEPTSWGAIKSMYR